MNPKLATALALSLFMTFWLYEFQSNFIRETLSIGQFKTSMEKLEEKFCNEKFEKFILRMIICSIKWHTWIDGGFYYYFRGLYWRKQWWCLDHLIFYWALVQDWRHELNLVVAKWHKQLGWPLLELDQWGQPKKF